MNDLYTINQIGDNKFRATFRVRKEYDPAKLEEDNGALRLSNERICIEVYPSFTLYYDCSGNRQLLVDPEVIYYDEFDLSNPKVDPWSKWIARHYFQPDYPDLKLTYEKTDGGFRVIRQAAYKDHVLKTEYTLEKNYPLKWGVYIQNLTAKRRMFKILVERYGVQANEIDTSEYSTRRGVQKIDDKFGFPYTAAMTDISYGKDGKRILMDDFGDELAKNVMLPVELDRDAKGKLFSGYYFVIVVEPYSTGGIDPYSYSNNTPTLDGYVYAVPDPYYPNSPDWYGNTTDTVIKWGSNNGSFPYRVVRGFVQWSLSGDLTPATGILKPIITSCKFDYAGTVNGGVDNEIRACINNLSPLHNDQIWSAVGNGTLLVTSSSFPVVGQNEEIDLGVAGCRALQDRVNDGSGFFALGFKLATEGVNHESRFSSVEGTLSPDPKLVVEYTKITPATELSKGEYGGGEYH